MFTSLRKKEKPFKHTFFKSVMLFLVVMFLPFVTHAATLSVSPSSGSYTVGQTFSVSFYLSSASQSTNAVSGSFNYSNENLEVVSVSKSGSVFNLWVQEPSYSNASGSGSFEGIILNPGFIGSSGKLITYTFRVKTAGTGTVRMGATSVLANDGNGTNIFTGAGSASFNLTAPAEKPAPAPVEKPTPVVETKPVNIPTPPVVVPVEPVTTGALTIKEIERVEATDPNVKFKISVINNNLVFKKYEIRLDQGEPIIWEDTTGKGIYEIPLVTPGKHTLLVKTVEHNTLITGYTDFSVEGLPLPEIMNYTKFSHISEQPIVIYGTDGIGDHITILFKQKGQEIYHEDVAVDAQGRFLFIIDKKIAPGKYTMELFSRNELGAASTHTDPVIIKVKRFAYLDFGIFTVSLPVFSGLAVILIVISVGMAIIFRQLYRNTLIKPRRKRLKEVITDSLT
jgi:hypothetical protein